MNPEGTQRRMAATLHADVVVVAGLLVGFDCGRPGRKAGKLTVLATEADT